MNKIQIISFIKEDRLSIKAPEMFLTKEDTHRNKRYYRLANDLIELLYLETSDLNESSHLSLSKARQHILLVQEMTLELEKWINHKFNPLDLLIFTGSKSSSSSSNHTIIEMQQLKSQVKFDLNVLVFLLNQNLIRSALKRNGTIELLLTGASSEKELVSTVVIQTLTQLSKIHTAKKLKLYLFTPIALSLCDLALIEDPIKEYLTHQRFEIEQIQKGYSSNQVYYAVCLSH